MSSLRSRILHPANEDMLVARCAEIVESFLTGTGGIKGFTLRSALTAARRSRPDLMQRAASRLLPELLDALDPIFHRHAGQRSFSEALQMERAAACAAVLAVADRRAQGSKNRLLHSVYGRMRDGAETDVARMLPQLGAMVDDCLVASRADG